MATIYKPLLLYLGFLALFSLPPLYIRSLINNSYNLCNNLPTYANLLIGPIQAKIISPPLSVDSRSTFLPPFLHSYAYISWWRGSVVERRSLAGELSLSCALPAADG